MLKIKQLNYLKLLNFLAISIVFILRYSNILSFFNQIQYRHLHVDERLVVINPILNVYFQVDIYDRFSEITPVFYKKFISDNFRDDLKLNP